MKREWLKCRVHKGMFSHEVVVEVRTADGQSIAHFVPKELVQRDRVLVQVERPSGKPMAILPTPEPYNAIHVRAEDLAKSP
jgi:hypothetical protein